MDMPPGVNWKEDFSKKGECLHVSSSLESLLMNAANEYDGVTDIPEEIQFKLHSSDINLHRLNVQL